MSGGHAFPPPGAPLPPDGGSTTTPGQPPADAGAAADWPAFNAGRGPAPGMAGTVHRPGAIPLRPLNLGAIYDGAFRIIRYNPKATVGAAALVTAVVMVVPVVISSLVAATIGASVDLTGHSNNMTGSQAAGTLISLGSLILASYAGQLAIVLVTAMVAKVTQAAAVGRRMTIGEAWEATRGKRWQVIGMTLLIALVWMVALVVAVGIVVVIGVATGNTVVTVLAGVLVGVLLIVLSVPFYIRVTYLAGPALLLEDGNMFHAMRRAVVLTRGQFWRIFGIALLTALITMVAGSLLATPVTVVGEAIAFTVPPGGVLVVLTVMQALSSVLQTSFTAPFVGAVETIQYLDQRIRKEGYDVELMRQAGILDR